MYGDIGTSPLYAVKECFAPAHRVEPTIENVLGILSLVFWSLTLVVVVKYLSFIMRADNRGEGGILALLALVSPRGAMRSRRGIVLIALGLFGAALLYGDGIITPAISVLSAVEGLEVATVAFKPFVLPVTIGILVVLFVIQKRGTAGIGAFFGPVMLVWFVAIAALGVPWIVREPRVLAALSPVHAARFFFAHGMHGFFVLGAVVLCITGGEALYADMGHFGKRPIRAAWYAIVFPALLLNYFGQGAILIARGAAVTDNPFYALAPAPLLYPLVGLATLATVVASQALISGAFSLTQQAVQLGYWPRVTIVHTSNTAEGQIYIPEVSRAMMISCVTLVLAFRESTNLAAAYGLAVTGTMSITSILFYSVARKRFRWSVFHAGAITATFLVFDLAFFFANVVKIHEGGWVPLAIAILVFGTMTTWHRGRALLARAVMESTLPLEVFMGDIARSRPPRVQGTAVFMTSNPEGAPPVLLHHFKHNKMLHAQVVLLSIGTLHVPEVAKKDRVESFRALGHGFFQIRAVFGFMQTPNVIEVLEQCAAKGLTAAHDDTSYYLGRETLLIVPRRGMARWRKILFAFLSRNARPANAFFNIPPNRVVELGTQIEL